MPREASLTLRVAVSTDCAALAISFIRALISLTPLAATRMFSEMFCVTEDCSSTEAAIAAEISLMREMVWVIASITLTALVVELHGQGGLEEVVQK